MKHSFPHKLQYAMNLTNQSSEAVRIVNDWTTKHGGNVEHLSTEQVRAEVTKELRNAWDKK